MHKGRCLYKNPVEVSYEDMQEVNKRRLVATLEISNACIQTFLEDADEKIIMTLCGKIAELLVTIAPQTYSEYMKIEKGKKLLCMECQNMIHNTSKAAL